MLTSSRNVLVPPCSLSLLYFPSAAVFFPSSFLIWTVARTCHFLISPWSPLAAIYVQAAGGRSSSKPPSVCWLFYFTFSSVISVWVSVRSFPRRCCMELTSFASAPLLPLPLSRCPGRWAKLWLQWGWAKLWPQWGWAKLWSLQLRKKPWAEQQAEAVCPWIYEDGSPLICTLQVTFVTLKSEKLILV